MAPPPNATFVRRRAAGSRGAYETRASLRHAPSAPARPRAALSLSLTDIWHAHLSPVVMEKRGASGRGEPIPSILKKPKPPRGDLVDKSTKIKREKTSSRKYGDVSHSLAHGCTPLMYACQQADYRSVVDFLNKDVSGPS